MGFNLDDYETVKDRITRFYAANPDACITTDLVSSPEAVGSFALFKASLFIGGIQRATGYAYEAQGQGVNRDAWVENAETSAIGRALANFNYCGSQRPSREEMSKTGIARDVQEMSDPRDSKGQYSPPTDPGQPAKKGDGIAGDMLKGRTAFNNLMVEKDDAGSMIFTPAEIKDIQSDLSPGGRVLISSQSDLDYLRDKYAKWKRIRDDILLHRAGKDYDNAVEGLDFGAVRESLEAAL